MTGVLRHIAKHRLNIREGCLPVRQKKKGQAPERNKAIYEEVEKLVDAGIMKEVHYHSWLSNPVMVKKHDGSWRMCVNFKDLNKACSKDGGSGPQFAVSKVFEGRAKAKWDAAAKEAISAVLMTERDGRQIPIYFVSSALQGPEINYTPMEKLILALVSASKRLKSFKLEEHDIHYRPRTLVKGQILADFIVERPEDDPQDTPMEDEEALPDPWILFTDRSSCIDGSRANNYKSGRNGIHICSKVQVQYSKTTLTIVGYGHDAAALSSELEEGGISQQLAWVWKAKMEQQVKAVTISSLPSPGFMEPQVGLMRCHNESDPYPSGAAQSIAVQVFIRHKGKLTTSLPTALLARYRKALRMMYYAHHHGFPIVTFIDTPRAFTEVKSEKLGQ
ncbi:reverse transcriptase domain-containing protein, partial [Tanacetum coccineum]